jgi:hypothetical protein
MAFLELQHGKGLIAFAKCLKIQCEVDSCANKKTCKEVNFFVRLPILGNKSCVPIKRCMGDVTRLNEIHGMHGRCDKT